MAARDVIGALLFIFFVSGTTTANDCIGHYYMELDCHAVTANGGCPVAYRCMKWNPPLWPGYTYTEPIKKICYYKGKPYKVGEQVPDNLTTDSSCSVQCKCTGEMVGDKWVPSFNCASVDCPVDGDEEDDGKCISVYETPTSCCPTKVCGPEVDKLSTCTSARNETYKEGQRWYPNDTCYVCQCLKQINGNEHSTCKQIICGLELNQQDNLEKKCAPVFSQIDSCCPNYFVCPNNSTKIIPLGTYSLLTDKCSLGSLSLQIGDTAILSEDPCLDCKCIIPPLVTCVPKKDCSVAKLD